MYTYWQKRYTKRKIEDTKEKEKMKKQNGITLIALVITIIILLILAGITINLTIRRTWNNKNGRESRKKLC